MRLEKSAIAHKIYSVKTLTWETACPGRKFRVEEICPYKTVEPFWKKDGGAVINTDIHTQRIFVRGGEWNLMVNNSGNQDCSIAMYLAFCHDGGDYQSLEGTVDEFWHPNMGGSRFHDAMKLSRWVRNIIIEKGKSKKFVFKIGAFNINVKEWFIKKSGWPFLYLIFNGCNPTHNVKLCFTMSHNICFTEGEDSRYALSREEINKFTRSIELIKQQLGLNVAGPADTSMDISAVPSG